MKTAIQLLAALLVVQALLALALRHGGNDGLATGPDNVPLLTVQADKIDRVTIEGADKARVELRKAEGSWQLADSGFPADKAKVVRLIDMLKGVRLGTPTATSAGAPERFKVAENNFERRITLNAGSAPQTVVLFGTAQGVHQVHARRADQKSVYAVNFSTYEAPLKAEEWQDKDLLQVPAAEIDAIEVAGLQLKRKAAGKDKGNGAKAAWQAEPLKAGERLKAEAVDNLARTLAELRIDKVLGGKTGLEYGLDKPVLALTIVRKDGQRIEYRLGRTADGKAHALRVSTRGEYFSLAGDSVDSLVAAARREALLGK